MYSHKFFFKALLISKSKLLQHQPETLPTHAQVEFWSSVAVVPNLTEAWTVEADCPCLDWAEGVTLTLALPSAPNPPWAANITLTAALSQRGGDPETVTVLGGRMDIGCYFY